LADLSLAEANIARPLRVFVAGPYIEKGWTAEQRATKLPAALLRLDLAGHIENVMGHQAVFGEHRGVQEIGDQHLRSRSSPTLVEIQLVKETCDAVVIIPASPGSYSELGAWSIMDKVCQKMLILGDVEHENKGGYLGMGVFKTAMDLGARLAWINYEDPARVVPIVEEFVEKIKDGVLAKKIVNG
jgi:hypothetical protein